MRIARRLALLTAAAAATGPLVPVGAAQPPTVPALLGAAAAYVARYEEHASGIVFEEDYVQQIRHRNDPRFPLARARRTRSEVVVLNTGDFGWIGFRNVLQVDGKPVSDRAGRLEKLFAAPVTNAVIGRARVVADESARYNLGGVQRNWNYPTMPLMFLRQAHQRRSSFAREGLERLDGALTWRLRFEETEHPTLIVSGRVDVAASGRFWIEPDSGRLRRGQLTVLEARASGTMDVRYGSAPGLEVLVPISMDERIEVWQDDVTPGVSGRGSPQEEIRGEARYSNFKQFTIEVQTTVSPR